jgi:predicted NAD/FAD-binding protein
MVLSQGLEFMNIAIIGTGISGLTAAYYLQHKHELTIFEKNSEIGGHTATKDIVVNGKSYAIDTGFIVFNDRTYPNFIELIDELGVVSKNTEMSFSVKSAINNLEYGGASFSSLFAQRRNIFNLKHWRMLSDILRFNREVITALDKGHLCEKQTLGAYLSEEKYSEAFISSYLVPMGCAIWSSSTTSMLEFPLYFFAKFFKNHGLLSVNDRPQWRVIKGGSKNYLAPLTKNFKQNIKTNSNIKSVVRAESNVLITMQNGERHEFDEVIFACHSDQAIRLLKDITAVEKEVLGAMRYQDNEVVLHTDKTVLPKRKNAWSSWNYWLRKNVQERAVLTYNMNILQGLDSNTTFCVTLNATDVIDPNSILARFNYSHPIFTSESVKSSQRWTDINGVDRTWFAGAYWGNGFHEDGVVSGKRVAKAINNLAISNKTIEAEGANSA